MTANDDTPDTGHESTDYEQGTFPLADEPDEEVAAELEAVVEEANEAVEVVTAALEGEEMLTDEKLQRVTDAGYALVSLTETAALRVPPEGRARNQR